MKSKYTGRKVEERLKRRLVGAAVLVALAVIFLPMLVEEREGGDTRVGKTNVPPRPQESTFQSRVLPGPASGSGPDMGPLYPLVPENPPQEPERASLESAEPAPSQASVPAPVSTQVRPPPQAQPKPQAVPPMSAQPQPAPAIPAPPQTRPSPAPPPPKTRVGVSSWVVQVGALESQSRAEQLVTDLRGKGQSAFIEPISVNGKTLHRVRVGPEIDRKRAEGMLEEIYRSLKIKGQVVAYP